MATDLASQVPVRTLADTCVDLLSFAFHLSRSPQEPGDAQTLSAQVRAMLDAMRQRASEAGYEADDIAQAQYALCALVDEIVLTSSWAIKSQWLGQPLQLQLFNSFNAGDEFYTRLDALKQAAQQDKGKVDPIEVYYLALCLGFKGRFGGVQGLEVLKKIRGALSNAIVLTRQERGGGKKPKEAPGRSGAHAPAARARGDKGGLSPRWRPPDSRAAARKELPLRMVAVLCLSGLLLLFVILAGALRVQSATVRDAVERAVAAPAER